ncbi:MAG: DUF2797 domain-containing protein [Deltaproteobacteria bacterium]|nr:DUF2797 domain-containing protein [Deltaproteobacteria bacterium]
MEQIRGDLRKMVAMAETPVVYRLPVGDQELPLNSFLGKTIRIEYAGEIHCLTCGRQTKKSFNQGYCYRCFSTLARCDLCIVKPELCHYAQGTCREPAWGQAHCMQPHYVYLANSSGLKVGITRASQIPTRWLDQGAVQALLWFRVPSRYQAGLLEVAIKKQIADRTDWRRMLTGEPESCDLKAQRDELLLRCGDDITQYISASGENAPAPLSKEEVHAFTYPIVAYPTRITALNLDKTARVEGSVLGIKGQYLLLDTGVLNIRKFTGYHVTVTV